MTVNCQVSIQVKSQVPTGKHGWQLIRYSLKVPEAYQQDLLFISS